MTVLPYPTLPKLVHGRDHTYTFLVRICKSCRHAARMNVQRGVNLPWTLQRNSAGHAVLGCEGCCARNARRWRTHIEL